MIYVDSERCTGCGACLEACPTDALYLEGGVANIDQDKCRECEACLNACPEKAILSVSETTAERKQVQAEPATAALTPQAERAPIVQPVSRALPWLGAALAFVGREIVPRVALSLLNSRDPRDNGSLPTSRGSAAAPSARLPTSSAAGRRRRLRRGRGRGGRFR